MCGNLGSVCGPLWEHFGYFLGHWPSLGTILAICYPMLGQVGFQTNFPRKFPSPCPPFLDTWWTLFAHAASPNVNIYVFLGVLVGVPNFE